MKFKSYSVLFIFFLVTLFFMDIQVGSHPGFSLVKEAQAIIGAPLSPLSFAGVARRTTRRAVVVGTSSATAAAAASTSTAATAPQAPPPQPAPAAPVSAVPIGTVVMELPKGCQSLVVENVNYSECAGAFYKTAFLSNTLVYVVVESPL